MKIPQYIHITSFTQWKDPCQQTDCPKEFPKPINSPVPLSHFQHSNLIPQKFLHHTRIVLFIATKDIIILHSLKTQFVHMDICSKGHEPNERIFRQELQSLNQIIGYYTQFFRRTANIKTKDKGGGGRHRAHSVFHTRRW